MSPVPLPGSRVLPDDDTRFGEGRASRATRDEIRSVPQPPAFQEGLRVIVMIGPAGSGKGRFVQTVTAEYLPRVRRAHLPGMQNVKEISFIDAEGRQTLLVDFPGFRKASSDADIHEIGNWVKDRFKSDAILSGLLFFHRTSAQATLSTLEPLAVFRKICGTTFANITVVTTGGNQSTRLEHRRQIKGLLRSQWVAQGRMRVQSFRKPYDATAQSILHSFEVLKPQSTKACKTDEGLVPHGDQLVRRFTAAINRSFSRLSTVFGTSKRKQAIDEVEASVPLLAGATFPEYPANTFLSTSTESSSSNYGPANQPLDGNSTPSDLPPRTPVHPSSRPTPTFRTIISLVVRVLKSQCTDQAAVAMLDDKFDWPKKLHDSAVFPSPQSRADATKFRSICDNILLDLRLKQPRPRICPRCRRRIPIKPRSSIHESPPASGPSTQPDSPHSKRRRHPHVRSKIETRIGDFTDELLGLVEKKVLQSKRVTTISFDPTFIHSQSRHTTVDRRPGYIRVSASGPLSAEPESYLPS